MSIPYITCKEQTHPHNLVHTMMLNEDLRTMPSAMMQHVSYDIQEQQTHPHNLMHTMMLYEGL